MSKSVNEVDGKGRSDWRRKDSAKEDGRDGCRGARHTEVEKEGKKERERGWHHSGNKKSIMIPL